MAKTDLEKLEELQAAVKRLVASKKQFNKLSEKRAAMSYSTHTDKAMGKANADLDWHAMDHDKLMHEAHAIAVDCGIAEPRADYSPIDYKPSGFHHYRHQPRLPLCRQEKEAVHG